MSDRVGWISRRFRREKPVRTPGSGESGPYDVADAPDDGVSRLDLGSVRLPMPDGAQLQVEVSPEDDVVRAVHVQTALGQFTVSAYAAPDSGGQWAKVCDELEVQLRRDDTMVHTEPGDWGLELVATASNHAIRFIGVDGPQWMLRGVVAGPPESAALSGSAMRDLLRNTVVVRGSTELPARAPLPIELPPEIAQHLGQDD